MFKLTDEQHEESMAWIREHPCSQKNEYGVRQSGAIGGAITFSFTPTLLGTVVRISCACGKEHDLTRYEEF